MAGRGPIGPLDERKGAPRNRDRGGGNAVPRGAGPLFQRAAIVSRMDLRPPRRRVARAALLIAMSGVCAGGCVPAPGGTGRVTEFWTAWYDSGRSRTVPVRLYVPTEVDPASPRPLVVFSHGVGESLHSYDYLGRHWAGDGYAVLFVQHAGSDVDAVDWDAVTPSLLRAARDPETWVARAADLTFALDRLAGHPEFAGRIDFSRIAVAGHSLGAHTALTLAGAGLDPGDGELRDLRDPRVTACLTLSPPAEGMLGFDAASWLGLRPPLLVAYGSLDTDIILKDATARRGVFDGALQSDRWLVVIDGIEHETFTGRDPAFPASSDAPRQHALIAELTTAWLNAYVRGAAAPAAQFELAAGRACHDTCTLERGPQP